MAGAASTERARASKKRWRWPYSVIGSGVGSSGRSVRSSGRTRETSASHIGSSRPSARRIAAVRSHSVTGASDSCPSVA